MSSGEFKPLDEKFLVEYIKATPSLYQVLGNNLHDLQIKEVGDGNLNFVFIVQTSSGSLVIKQVLMYLFIQTYSCFANIYSRSYIISV